LIHEQGAEMVGNIDFNRPKGKVLRALDSDIPLLATRAAIELDRLLADDNIGLTNVGKLASLLQESQIVNSATKNTLLDPATLTVMNRAITEADLGRGIIKVEDLIKKAYEIANKLAASEDELSKDSYKDELRKLKKFCMALSNLSASYRQSLFGNNTLQPNHR
jgi:hypothetical protein